MKIRSHLLLLVAATVIPLAVFAAGLTLYSGWEQRNAVELRQLERVRSMTIAVDTELQASVRVLRVLALSPTLDPASLPEFAERMRGVLSTQPLWSGLAIGDPGWKDVVAVTPAGVLPQAPPLDATARERALSTRLPAVSGIVPAPDGLYTQVLVPVLRGDGVALLLVANIEQKAWLGFMSQYPTSPGAIMTLIDADGRIIARTRNNDRYAGKPASPKLLEQSRTVSESTFRNTTLEGDAMYSAHSRSVRWGWTIATGVPAASVEEALRDSTLLLAGGVALSLSLAGALAVVFGRRIQRPVAALEASAHALASGEDPGAPETGHIDEVAEVASAFHRASDMLRERSRALAEALRGEQQARREAEQASEAKDEFLAMLGHELRNPLNALTSAVAVQERAPAGADRSRSREIIQRQLASLRDLVDDLLDVARVTRGKIALQRKVTDLGRIVRRTVMVMSGAARLGVHELEVDCGEAWVCADETRIEQIVSNLLDNAAKYTPEGGRIAVRVAAEGGEAVLRIEDSGMGIPPDLLPRVFDLFTQGERTLDRSQGGLGLGLALVRRLVELHGGKVSASSAGTGRGACFTVRMPLHEAPGEAAVVPEPAPGKEKKLKILIVEDNPDGRETLAMMLSMEGHEVHEAENGPVGVEQAESVHPDAAIVDIGLPGFDGYEVARRIRSGEGGNDIRLVALTGYGQEEDRQKAMRAGFDWFMVKPANLDELASILATV